MHASIHLLRIVKIDTKSVLLVPLLGRIWCKIQTGLCLVSIPCWIWCCYCKSVNGRCQLYAPSIVATFCGWHTFFDRLMAVTTPYDLNFPLTTLLEIWFSMIMRQMRTRNESQSARPSTIWLLCYVTNDVRK